VLEARNLCKAFGGVVAVDNVSLSLKSGEVVGLVGPNGSGKSTLLDLLRGSVKPDKGVVTIEGKVITDRPFLELNGASQQVFRSYQVPRIFAGHTVSENFFLGQWGVGTKACDISEANNAIVTLPNLSQIAGTLSVGQRRRLTLSWLYQRLNTISFFLLDEPSAGGDAEYISGVVEFIRTARSKGKGLLVVEHNHEILAAIADRFLYMTGGRCQEETPFQSLHQDRRENVAPDTPSNKRGLRLQDVTVIRSGAPVLRKVSLAVTPGEIMGLMGPNGGGKSTLLLALYGDPTCQCSEGTIWDGNDELACQSIDSRIARNIHLLPQEGGVFKSMTVAETLRASLETSCVGGTDTVNIKGIASKVPHLKRIWQRRCGALSGGERRLVGLARILVLNPRYALLDEPSAGLDEEAKKEVARLITGLASHGVGILIAEQDQGFIESLCTRVMYLDSAHKSESECG
jgi:ABC-type branched-subunit amino acid transport system ATPase component